MNVPSSFIYNSQKLETIQISIYSDFGYILIYSYNRIYSAIKNNELLICATWINLNIIM